MISLEIQELHDAGSAFLTIVDSPVLPPVGTTVTVKVDHHAARFEQGRNVFGTVKNVQFRPQTASATVFLENVTWAD